MKLKLLRQIEQLEQKAEKGEGINIYFAEVDAQGNESPPKLFMSTKDGLSKVHDNS